MSTTFLKYSDLPIFAEFIQENFFLNYRSAEKLFAATEASLALDPNLSANRYLGKAQIKNDFSTVGPLEGKFSFTFYPLMQKDTFDLWVDTENQKKFFDLTGQFTTGHQIYFSNFLLKRCYLQNYSVKINPYQPVSVSANFISYDVRNLKGQTLEKFNDGPLSVALDPTKPYYDTLHALTTKMDGSSVNIPNAKISIEVNVDCQRTPVYTLGQQVPDSVVLTSAERTTTIQGENVGAIVDITGANAGATNIYFLPFNKKGQTIGESNNVLNFDINGRIVSQQLQVAQNSMLNGRVVIKEILL
jgi:hypothetical protein